MKAKLLMFMPAAFLLSMGTVAKADFSVEDLHVAATAATEKFSTDNPDHVAHFVGYKVWKSGEESKVKVYVSHDGMNMEFNYMCHKHDDGIECHNQ